MWSPEFTSGDFIFHWVIADSGMLEVGARQLINRRLHELPDFLPFCGSGALSTYLHCSLVPRHHFRLPGRYTSPPVLSEDLSSEKTKRVTTTPIYVALARNFKRFVLSAPLTLHQTLHPSLDTWLHQRLSSVTVCASQTRFEKPLNPFSLYCSVPPWWSGVMTWHPATVWACWQGAWLARGKEVGGLV